MYKLILKDLLVQKKMLAFSIIYTVIFMFAFQHTGSAVLPVSVIALTYVLVTGACSNDDKNKTDMILNSLPIRRVDIVASKYLSIIVFGIIGVAAYAVMFFLVTFTGFPFKVYGITAEGLAGAFLSISLMNSIYFPIYFKFGYTKSRIVNFIMFFAFFFGVQYIMVFIKDNTDIEAIKSMVAFFSMLTGIKLSALFAVFALSLMGASFWVSLMLYRRREF